LDRPKIEVRRLRYVAGDTEILAGADPLEAVRLQIVVLYMLLGSVSIAAILVGTLSYRSFFTPRHQIRKGVSDE